ncbi:MAG: hypothetical protein GC168_20535 [Candidatus Hydrogenedens sp.]|nr:hypothetical protein [Candidatus Hydrogenedens sp.]
MRLQKLLIRCATVGALLPVPTVLACPKDPGPMPGYELGEPSPPANFFTTVTNLDDALLPLYCRYQRRATEIIEETRHKVGANAAEGLLPGDIITVQGTAMWWRTPEGGMVRRLTEGTLATVVARVWKKLGTSDTLLYKVKAQGLPGVGYMPTSAMVGWLCGGMDNAVIHQKLWDVTYLPAKEKLYVQFEQESGKPWHYIRFDAAARAADWHDRCPK